MIELIVVIAILGILAAILIPVVTGFVEQTKLMADQVTVRTLNTVTPLYRVSLSASDPFADEANNNETLMQELVDKNYLAAAIKPQSKDTSFVWLFDAEKWYLLLATHSM